MEKLLEQIHNTEATYVSSDKAYCLFWLGRYAERVYMSLHLLRKYFDADIDGVSTPYALYCEKLHIPYHAEAPENDIATLLYGESIANSLLSGLARANDNGLVLRVELGSETLSYIQMSLCHMKVCAAEKEMNITHLQSVTDNLMAFFGSAEERILSALVKDFLHLGRFAERLDMEIRFGYGADRIIKTFYGLNKIARKLPMACDVKSLNDMGASMVELNSKGMDENLSDRILSQIWSLLKI